MYWLSNLMCDLIFSIYNPSYYHLFLKEQECHVMISFFKTKMVQNTYIANKTLDIISGVLFVFTTKETPHFLVES